MEKDVNITFATRFVFGAFHFSDSFCTSYSQTLCERKNYNTGPKQQTDKKCERHTTPKQKKKQKQRL